MRQLVWVITAAALVLVAGFVAFVELLPKPGQADIRRADGIVALTGEGGRLIPAMDLLSKGLGRRLLITGVNPATSKGDLKALLRGGDLFDCCVDLGFTALDTRGNAEETASWAHSHGYTRLIIVTADYHMPRSLVEFGTEMPDVKLVPYPVPDAANTATLQTLRRLAGEYLKYVASSVRAFVVESIPQSRS